MPADTQLLLYEFVSGGGWWTVDPAQPPTGSLLAEGDAMVSSIAEDFSCRAPAIEVTLLRDSRLPWRGATNVRIRQVASASEERAEFLRVARESKFALLIAPEFDAHLLTRCRWASEAGVKLLSPGAEFVGIASDKQRTAEVLAGARVPVPRGFQCGTSLRGEIHDASRLAARFPAVIKPCDGAGSMGVFRVVSWADVEQHLIVGRDYRLEEFVPGLAASVAVIGGPNQTLFLPACRQVLSADGRFRYLGGETPLAPALCQRAERLARWVVAALPPTVGYFGIDLVLGEANDGSRDVVIEINPRLTTSYIGLRQLARQNLAEAMLRIALGQPTELSFDSSPIQFAASSQDK